MLIVGLLLAAGKGVRFDVTGQRNKLLQPVDRGARVVERAAVHLLAATPHVVAVVRQADDGVARVLQELGCQVLVCPQADEGMGVSLAHGARALPAADGVIVALGDMPFVAVDTLSALADAIVQGAGIAVPVCGGRRGNPVAFAAQYIPRLQQMHGDQGARQLLKSCPVREIPVQDRGIFRDVDSPADLGSHTDVANEGFT